MLDERSSALLTAITSNRVATIQQLMYQMNCTRRQIVYDLGKINEWLKANGLPPIKNERSRGLSVNDAVRRFVVSRPLEVKGNSYFLSKEERALLIVLLLFIRCEPISLYHLISILQMSRNTTLADIQEAKRLAVGFNVEIAYTRKEGYHLIGEERDQRSLVLKCVSLLLQQMNGLKLLALAIDGRRGKGLFDDLYNKILEGLKEIEQSLQVIFVEEKMYELAAFLVVLFRRMQNGKSIAFTPTEQSLLAETREFKAARKLLEMCGQHVEQSEIYYVTLQLLGISMRTGDHAHDSQNMQMLYELIADMVDEFERLACVSFVDREKVVQNLILHLKPAYYRILFHIPIVNPFLPQIKSEHFDLFTLVKKASEKFEQFVGCRLPEDEIGYLTLHFGALLEAQGELQVRRKRAIIICPNGIGTSNMLRNQIEKLVPELAVVDTISLREFKPEHEKACDLIFSTVPIQTNKPLILVNPILSGLDKAKIYQEVHLLVHGKQPITPNVQDIVQTVKQFSHVFDEDGLRSGLAKVLTRTIAENIRRYKPMLKELLTEEMIQMRDRVSNWEEAIEIAAQPLLETNAIEPRYIEAMIRNVRELGPYIVLTPNVAVPHARPEDGVKKIGISLLRVKEKVAFSDDEDHHANLVVVLAAVDNETHLRALGQLTELISETENVDRLIAAADKDEILAMVERYSLK